VSVRVVPFSRTVEVTSMKRMGVGQSRQGRSVGPARSWRISWREP